MSGSNYTQTPNLKLYKPNFAADYGNWGTHLNANSDVLDNLPTQSGNDGRYLQLSGGTVVGIVTFSADLVVNGNGVVYKGSNQIAFSWDGTALHGVVDTADQGPLSTHAWVTAQINAPGVPSVNAANDAAAASAGVPVGGRYRNGSVLMVRVS